MSFERPYTPATNEDEGVAFRADHVKDKMRMTAMPSPWPGRLRVIILLITIGITATAIAMAFVVVKKSIQQKNRIVSHFLVAYFFDLVSTMDHSDIYIPNIITIVGSIGLLGSAMYALGASLYSHRSSHLATKDMLKSASTFETPVFLVIGFTIWMFISLIFESIWFHKGRITITRNDGLSIPPWDVINALVELGIADRFRNVHYWRCALGFQWAAAAAGFIASILLVCGGVGIQTSDTTTVTPRDIGLIKGSDNGQYHYTKRTSATNLDSPVAKRMSAREVVHPDCEDEIVIQPRTSADRAQGFTLTGSPDAQCAPRFEDRDGGITLHSPYSAHTPLTPRSALVGLIRGSQFSALQVDGEGDIVEVPLDEVAPPVRVDCLDDGTHTFVQNDDTPSREKEAT